MEGGVRCGACGGTSLRMLGRAASARDVLVTSDAQRLADVAVQRTLCERCACIEVHYDPPDRLRRYFATDYDLADEIQSNLIVRDGRSARKHDHIQERLFALLGELPRSGRYLEIACGRGELARRFQAEFPQWTCFGVDPSAQSPPPGGPRPGEVTFVRGYFSEQHFAGMTFDVIVAHGFLNRSPVLPELLRIREFSQRGTRLSVEVGVLEDSIFTPHVWDHPYMYLESTFESYLRQAGFTVRARTDCVSSRHFLCECTGDPQPAESIRVAPALVEQTQACFRGHVTWWREAVDAFGASATTEHRPLGLYGAGVYSAVLLSLLPPADFAFVVDDLKAGATFRGLPVLSVAEAARLPGARVYVCARPAYVGAMTRRLREHGLEHVVLSPAGVMVTGPRV